MWATSFAAPLPTEAGMLHRSNVYPSGGSANTNHTSTVVVNVIPTLATRRLQTPQINSYASYCVDARQAISPMPLRTPTVMPLTSGSLPYALKSNYTRPTGPPPPPLPAHVLSLPHSVTVAATASPPSSATYSRATGLNYLAAAASSSPGNVNGNGLDDHEYSENMDNEILDVRSNGVIQQSPIVDAANAHYAATTTTPVRPYGGLSTSFFGAQNALPMQQQFEQAIDSNGNNSNSITLTAKKIMPHAVSAGTSPFPTAAATTPVSTRMVNGDLEHLKQVEAENARLLAENAALKAEKSTWTNRLQELVTKHSNMSAESPVDDLPAFLEFVSSRLAHCDALTDQYAELERSFTELFDRYGRSRAVAMEAVARERRLSEDAQQHQKNLGDAELRLVSVQKQSEAKLSEAEAKVAKLQESLTSESRRQDLSTRRFEMELSTRNETIAQKDSQISRLNGLLEQYAKQC